MGTYSIADMLIKIKNGAMAKKESVDVNYSRFCLDILNCLRDEGYIKSTRVTKEKGKNIIRVVLKYADNKKSVISGIKLFSTPGRRMYYGYRDIIKVRSGVSTLILSTPAGVITDREARMKKVGGELICAVW